MANEQTPLVLDADHGGSAVGYNATEDQDAKKAVKKPTPLPKMQIFAMFLIQFCEPVTATVVYPFVVSLVNETGITGGDPAKTGYYAGIIESVFFASEASTAFAWGRTSDYIGRKLPLLFGMLIMSASILSFGLSNAYWSLIASRCVQGFMNGNIGITKSVMADLTDSTNIATAFSFMPLVWGVGIVLGPMVGGIFAHPAEQWPDTFGKVKLLVRYPYVLPCAIAAVVPLGAFFFTAIFFKESLKSVKQNKKNRDSDSTLSSDDDATLAPPAGPPPLRSLATRPVITLLVNYAFLAWTEQALTVLITLVYPTPIEYGGLGLSSFTIGVILSCIGVSIGLISTIAFPRAVRRYGALTVYRTSFFGYLVTPILWPLMGFFARRQGGVGAPIWVLIGTQVATATLCCQCFGSFFILLSEAVPSQSLGALNGLAQTVACTMRIFAPFTSSSLFSLSQEKNLLGGTLVFWVIELVAILGVVASRQIVESTKSEEDSD